MPYNEDIAARLMRDLMFDFDLTREQAAGVVGNLAFESTGFREMQERDPAVEGSRGGYGYAQWTGPRRRDFEAFAEARGLDINSYEANYGFLAHELSTNHAYSLNPLRRAGTPHEATEAFVNHYEYPDPERTHLDERKSLSMHVFMNPNLGFEAPTPTPRPDPGSVSPQRTPSPDSDLRSPQRAPRPDPGFEAQPRGPMQNPGFASSHAPSGVQPGFPGPHSFSQAVPGFPSAATQPHAKSGFPGSHPHSQAEPGFPGSRPFSQTESRIRRSGR